MPLASISLVDVDRIWLKAQIGMGSEGASRKDSFCGHAILAGKPNVIEAPNNRFYAGVPLKLPSGQNVGTICVFDYQHPCSTAIVGATYLQCFDRVFE